MIPPAGFEWDERKRRLNLTKHGLDFVDAILIFTGIVLERPVTRDGEARIEVMGEVEGRIVFVIFTWRGGRGRIISARAAKRQERETYQERSVEGS